MQYPQSFNQASIHDLLICQMRSLFNRRLLCTNNYLYRQMRQDLSFPLYVIVEERNISNITHNENYIVEVYDVIQKAIEMSEVIRLSSDKRFVQIIEFPTVKITNKEKRINEIKKLLLDCQKLYDCYYEDNHICVTLLEEAAMPILQNLLKKMDPPVKYYKASLYQDITHGVNRANRLKKEQMNKNMHYNNSHTMNRDNFNLEKPPAPFIRRAVESDDEDQLKVEVNGKQEKNQKKKYKEVAKNLLINDDFPPLC